MRKFVLMAVAIIAAVMLFALSNPTRAIKADALLMGCDVKDVISAEFEKDNDTNPASWGDKYITQSELEDKITGTGHSTWYVHKIVFIYIPEWAGNG